MKKGFNSNSLIGLALILLGIIFIADNLDFYYFDFTNFLFQWEIIIIIVGIIILRGHKDSLTGIILILVGGLSLGFDYFDASFSSFLRDFWPIGLIVFGLYILYQRDKKPNHNSYNNEINDATSNDQGYIDVVSIINTVRNKYSLKGFRGGKITTVFGASEIDLEECELSDGKNYLEVTTLFGGTEIVPPKDQRIILKVVSIFGGSEDKSRSNLIEDDKRLLIIKGVTIFGGCEIK